MSEINDDLVFADGEDSGGAALSGEKEPWKIMIVDDDPAVHDVTKLALDGFMFGERVLNFIQCFSGDEARKAITENPDTALVLLDVVMESDHAGLEVAQFIREEARNQRVRIVLRTGQPGQAPERRVITDYDINDYKEKTELTATKLFTVVFSALRSYRDIETIEDSKTGLTQVIEASAQIFKLLSIDQFTKGVLQQLVALLKIDPGALYVNAGGLATKWDGELMRVIAGTGVYDIEAGAEVGKVLSPDQQQLLENVRNIKANVFDERQFVGFFEDRIGNQNLLYVDGIERVGPVEKDLVELFVSNVSIALENIYLHEDIEETQREIVYMLGEAVETRSQETGNHVKRVAEISKLLALEIGIDRNEAEIVKFASPLHDLGKIAIPDAILNKKGRHTEDERVIMKTHAEIGHRMLAGSKRRILQAGAIIALEHHERWDGKGYPRGRGEDDIHIYGRVTAVADVYDALGSDRCYKKAWPLDEVLALFREERGKQFDPNLVDAMFDNLDRIKLIQEQFSDSFTNTEWTHDQVAL